VSDEEPVTSPDQHKPTPVKAAYIAGLVVAAILLLMLIGNHKGHVEDIWLIGIAATIVLVILTDWAQRRNGLKPKR
jgi:ABC-type enterobactin transport system permease subunit